MAKRTVRLACLVWVLASGLAAAQVTQVQVRRGTTAQVAAATPAEGEIVYDTTLKRLVLGDGATQGGGATLLNASDLASLYQPLDSDLTAISALATTAAGRGLLSLSDPDADRLLFWDDSAGAFAHLTLGSGLSISGTTITASGGTDLSTLLTTRGDLVYRNATEPARLAVGASGTVLVGGTDPAWSASPTVTSLTAGVGSASQSTVLLRSGTNPQAMEVSATYTNGSNFRSLFVGYSTYWGTGTVISAEGSGTGANPNLILGTQGSGVVKLAPNGGTVLEVQPGYVVAADTATLGWSDAFWYRQAAAHVSLRNSTTAQKLSVAGTYTDASNYVRASLTSNGTSSITLAAETAGTGADNVDVVISPAGTGVVNLKSFVYVNDNDISVGAHTGMVRIGRPSGGGVYAVRFGSSGEIGWEPASISGSGGTDSGLARHSAGVVKATTGTAAGIGSFLGSYKSSDGTAGVTVTTCTSFKDGLCVAGS